MSTKTTFKRIALVTVAALGFGVLSSVAPASAATYTSMTVGYNSLTVVGAGASGFGLIPVNTVDDAGDPSAIFATESLTATVTAWPTGVDSTTAAADLVFTIETRTTGSNNAFSDASAIGQTSPATNAGSAWIGQNSGGQGASITNRTTGTKGTYWFAVKPAASGKAVDKGTYTVRFRLTDSTNFITSVSIPVNFVSSAADSGAAITIATVGTFTSGESTTMTATKSVKATLTNGVAGGHIQLGTNGATIGVPVLSAATWDATTPSIVDPTASWQVTDTGTQVTSSAVAGDFYSATASDTQTAWTSAQNGVYGIVSAVGTGLTLTDASVTPYFRVTYGSVAATKAITIVNAASGAAGVPALIATGALATTCTTACYLPLTTKTASFTVASATAGKAYSYSVAYTLTAAADQTPLAATPTTVYASASGVITVPVTNANPIDGATATITISGFATNPVAQILTWKKSSASAIAVDLSGAYVALKSTNVFTVTITDVFGAGVAGVVLQPALSTGSANYSATAVIPTTTTGADGKATFSLTDAAAVAAGTDVVSFSAVAGTSLTGTASSTITYAATAPAATSLAALVGTATSDDTAVVTPVVSAVSVGTYPVKADRNNSLAVTATATNEIKVRISAGVAGAKVVATGSTGVYFVGSTGFLGTTASKYTGSTGYTAGFVIGSTYAGTNTVTFTQGSVTTTVIFKTTTAATNARFVKVSQAAAGGVVIVSVTDRFGNGVATENVQVSTSAGTLGNGQMTTVYATDLTGNVSVVPTGSEAATITATLSASEDTSSLVGYMGTTVIDPTVAAGNRTATASVTPAGTAQDAASAAGDAAAEATDAANAATDAANAAAEAADAATAAAQDAADAVAALSAQVATLISGLKAQLTALTNLVIKIQKKVKA